jgi:hypothetical protein
MKVLVIIILVTSIFCGCKEDANAQNTHQAKEQVTTIQYFSMGEKSPCQFIDIEKVANTFKIEKNNIKAKSDRDKPDNKICRYEINTDAGLAVLNVSIKYNNRQEKNPNQHSKRLAQALKEGLVMPGTNGETQKFMPIEGLGTTAIYADNITYDKNLLFLIGEDYLIRLEYNQYGANLPNLQKELVDLALEMLK